MNKFVVEIKNSLPATEIGGKGHSLAVLTRNGFNVPQGFVITSAAFFKFLESNSLMEKIEKLASEMNEDNFRETSKGIRQSILEGKIFEDLTSRIEESLKGLGAKYVSIRSSAASEDSLKASFAGLHDTFLNVKSQPELILGYVKKCWASLFNERAVAYRIKKGIPHLEGMAVIVQKMILAQISGVTFTVHPLNEKSLLVEASYGLGDMIVSGRVGPDDYSVDRESLEILEKKIGKKNKMSTIEGEEIKIVDMRKELAEKQALSHDKIKEIAKACLQIEEIFNYPQDIEWCISNDKLWLLQSRAITRGLR